MAQLPQAANTADNASQGGFEVIPEGEYLAQLTKSEWRDTKNKQGKYIYMEFTVLEGEHTGRILFERLNLINNNDIAVRIANETMNKICSACLKAEVLDSDELHGIPMRLRVDIDEQENTDWPATNRIRGYSHPDGVAFDAPWE